MKRLQQGFTLVEIMIVVAIIGLLAAIAIPNFMKSRETTQRNACINNLRMIDAAKEQWALENNKGSDDEVEDTEVVEYIKGEETPVCPSGGTYTFGDLKTYPVCSIEGHVLPADEAEEGGTTP